MILRHRNTGALVVSLLLAGCSSSSPDSTGDGTSSSGSGGSSGSSSHSGSSGAGSGATGTSGGGDEDGSVTTEDDASGVSNAEDGGDEDATPPGRTRDGGTRDASARDAATTDGAVIVTPTGDGGDALAAARAQCVQIINADRATLSPPSPPLTEDTAEEPCVDGQAQADYTANTAHSAFGKCKESAQDECPGWPGPPSSIDTKCLAQMWAEGPPPANTDNHWLNMSNAKYKKVACGFYQTPSGKWWATQDFY